MYVCVYGYGLLVQEVRKDMNQVCEYVCMYVCMYVWIWAAGAGS